MLAPLKGVDHPDCSRLHNKWRPVAKPISPTQTTAETKRRYGRPTTIGAVLPRATATALGNRGFANGSVINRWAAIVGDDLASVATPLEVKFPRHRNDQATLVLQVSSGAAATLLQMKAPLIIARVNGFLGHATISRVQAQQGPLPQKRARAAAAEVVLSPEDEQKVLRATTHISSPDIKAALIQLGFAIARRNQGAAQNVTEKQQTSPAQSQS